MSQQPSKGGYMTVKLSINGRVKRRIVSRLIALAFIGPCPDDHECAHLNGKRTDNRPDNLKWATPRENQGHRRAHGTLCIGEKNGSVVLTARQVIAIRALVAQGQSLLPRSRGRFSQPAIARRYGISRQTVSAIALREIWQHV